MTITLLNITPGQVVHHHLLLIHGIVSNDSSEISIRGHEGTNTWEVCNGYFKGLVFLTRGMNTLILTAGDDKLKVELEYKHRAKKVLKLAILLASDSNGEYDVPEKWQNRPHGLSQLIEKVRMAGYLNQAFTAEQMWRKGLGMRTFDLEEEQVDGLWKAKVYIVRSSWNKQILRLPHLAQQHKNKGDYPTGPRDLFDAFLTALEEDGSFEGEEYVAGILADSTYDKLQDLILAHTALGGGAGNVRLGIFGSHTCYSWPSKLSEVQSCFKDTTLLDNTKCGNDNNACGEHWRAANVGIGAWNHEVGHSLTLSHTPSGHMARGYENYNRSFCVTSPDHQGVVRMVDEAGSHWHPRDVVRLRHHTLLKLPGEPDERVNGGPVISSLDKPGCFSIKAPTNIRLIEVDIDDHPRPDLDIYLNQDGLELSIDELTKGNGGKVTIEVILENQESVRIEDLQQEWNNSRISTKGINGIKGQVFGHGNMNNTQSFIAPVANLESMRVWGGQFLDGILFEYSDGKRIAAGNVHNGRGGTRISIDSPICRVHLRSGAWLDGIEFESNKLLGWIGGDGGGLNVLEPPEGHEIVGFIGSGVPGEWMDSFAIIYSSKRSLQDILSQVDDLVRHIQVPSR